MRQTEYLVKVAEQVITRPVTEGSNQLCATIYPSRLYKIEAENADEAMLEAQDRYEREHRPFLKYMGPLDIKIISMED